MSATDHRSRDVEALGKRLESLEIVVSEVDGGYTVASYCEPLFCFDAKTLDDVNQLVIDTIRSYILTFYQVQDVSVGSESIPIEADRIPVRQVKPISVLKPSVTNLFTNRSQYAIA